MNSQCVDIICFMRSNSITTQDARSMGILSLSRRICDLKEKGYLITVEMIQVKTKRGKTKIARYTLQKEPNPKILIQQNLFGETK